MEPCGAKAMINDCFWQSRKHKWMVLALFWGAGVSTNTNSTSTNTCHFIDWSETATGATITS